MNRVYLDYSTIKNNQVVTEISLEIEALEESVTPLDIKTISYIYDTESSNVMEIVQGVDADKLGAYMFPPNDLSTLINDLSIEERISVITELNGRGIITDGSITCGDLLNNICLFFNADFESLGSIMNEDFS